MGRRTLLLVAAILLAAIGTGVLFLYVNAAGDALKGSPGKDLTAVMVPLADIPEGMPIAKTGQFRSVQVDSALATQGQYVTADGFNKYIGKVATQRLYAFSPVTAQQLGDNVAGSSKIQQVPGMQNMAIELDDPAKVGDFLYPGAHVALWVLDPDTKTAKHQVEVVLPNVMVVTTGSQGTIRRPSDSPTDSPAAGQGAIVTIQVKQDDAGKVLLAKQSGDLYLTLVGSTPASVQTYSVGTADGG